MKSLKRLVIFLFLIILVFIGNLTYHAYRYLHTPFIPNGVKLHYIFLPGSKLSDLTDMLAKKGYLQHPQYLIWYARLHGDIGKIKAGEYIFPAGITPLQLLYRLTNGIVVHHSLTIIEGWTFKKMLAEVDTAPYLMHQLDGLSTDQIMIKLGLPNREPEGLFFPSTYHYQYGATDLSVLQMAYNTMQKKLAYEWKNRAKNLNYTNAYQALIVASMIEKETSVPKERPMIAGVILNRLVKRMYLQIDPTVIYGLGKLYDGMITKKDLRLKTPYNTYTNKGLPPTPIALPGLPAMQAALHPTMTDALYYVATGYGGHYFSATLQEHYAAIKRYQTYQEAQLRKHTLPLTSTKTICSSIKITKRTKSLCSPCWYLPTSLQFICPVAHYG